MGDKLFEAVKYYDDNLNNHNFYMKVGNRKKEILELKISFRTEHLKHLLGLNKLTDLGLQRFSSDVILQNTLNHELNLEYISKSYYFKDIKNRIENFSEIRNLLFTEEIMLGKINEKFFKTIEADYLLIKNLGFGIAHLFLKKDSFLTIPVTFFTAPTNIYLHTKRWTILEVKEIIQIKQEKRVRKRKETSKTYKL